MTPRVLHVSQAMGYGVSSYLENLLADQVGRGWDVRLASPPDSDIDNACAALGIVTHAWPARRSPGPSAVAEAIRLRRIVARADPEIVHLHSSKAGLVGRLVVRGRRATIFTPHAWSFLHEGSVMQGASRLWERSATRWTTVLLCGSEGERAAGEAAGVKAEYRVVPNAVDLRAFPPATADERAAARHKLGRGATPLAVCVGRLAPQKGQMALLDAWRRVQERMPEATLILVGDGPDRDRLTRQAPANVVFAGPSDAVRDWYVAADVVVQPSRWEVISLSLLEAMACGRSVVVTDVEGMREALGDGGECGAVVPRDDATALADAIVMRLADPDQAAAEGRAARVRAEGFGVGPWGEAIATVTREALASGPRA